MAAEIRIQQGRAKPIDILYKNLSVDADFDFEMNEPYKIFKVCSLFDLFVAKNISLSLSLSLLSLFLLLSFLLYVHSCVVYIFE
jgi:Conserved mid region of cactin